MHRFFKAMSVVAALLAPVPAVAGSSAASNPVLPRAEVISFADRVSRDLAARGAQVAIVARVGRDPSVLPDGIDYTHVAFWVYSDLRLANGQRGRGYRIYNLYQRADDLTRSDLVQDDPNAFFANVHTLDAGVIIPDARLQARLLEVIAGPAYAALHNPSYSVLANPADGRFQNCTEHTLHVLMAALYATDDSAQIKANIAAHFTPQPVEVNGVARFFATAASAALTTQDHGAEVGTATFGSIARFMQEYELSALTYRITPDQVVRYSP